jgi:nicotinate-nucleotide adenylyltransferase
VTEGRRIGVLGGSFDPPHVGHLILAQEAWWQLGLDELRLVPCRDPPHKPGPHFDAELRARLVAQAVEGHPALTLSRAEVDRPGPSYTVETLEALAADEPGARLWFVMGGDQLLGFSSWRAPARIVELARLAVAVRNGASEALEAVAQEAAPGRVDWVEMPKVAISSSMIRARLAAGQPVRYLVPAGLEEELRGVGGNTGS